jgi:hypothetical protein
MVLYWLSRVVGAPSVRLRYVLKTTRTDPHGTRLLVKETHDMIFWKKDVQHTC